MGSSYKTIITKDGRKIIKGDYIEADVLEADEIYARKGIKAGKIRAGKIKSGGSVWGNEIHAKTIDAKEDLHVGKLLEADDVKVKRKYWGHILDHLDFLHTTRRELGGNIEAGNDATINVTTLKAKGNVDCHEGNLYADRAEAGGRLVAKRLYALKSVKAGHGLYGEWGDGHVHVADVDVRGNMIFDGTTLIRNGRVRKLPLVTSMRDALCKRERYHGREGNFYAPIERPVIVFRKLNVENDFHNLSSKVSIDYLTVGGNYDGFPLTNFPRGIAVGGEFELIRQSQQRNPKRAAPPSLYTKVKK